MAAEEPGLTLYDSLMRVRSLSDRAFEFLEREKARVKEVLPHADPQFSFSIADYDVGATEAALIRTCAEGNKTVAGNKVVCDAVNNVRSVEGTAREVSSIYANGVAKVCKWIKKDEERNTLCAHLGRAVPMKTEVYLTRGFWSPDNLTSGVVIFTPLSLLAGAAMYVMSAKGGWADLAIYLGAVPAGLMTMVEACILGTLRNYRQDPLRDDSDELGKARELDEIINSRRELVLNGSKILEPVSAPDID